VAPGSGDARGECPGLNALANHNYLPHNGIATINEFVSATGQVFGMGADLALFLSTYGAVIDGSGTSWSISGGPHVGIGGSHGNYETDSSPLKSDLYQYGSNSKLILEQFHEVKMSLLPSPFASDSLAALRHAAQRCHRQLQSRRSPYVPQPALPGEHQQEPVLCL